MATETEPMRIKERPASAEGNLGPAPPGVGKPGRKKRADAGQPRAKGERQPRRKTSVDRAEVYELVGFPIVVGNEVGKLNQYWREKGSLTGTEIGKLSVALGDEVMENRTLLKYLHAMSGSAVHIRLAGAILAILVPRMADNGLLPAELADAFRAVDGATPAGQRSTEASAQPSRDSDATLPNGTRGTRVVYGSNGQREVDGTRSDTQPGSTESWEDAAPETIQDSVEVEA